MPPIDRRGVSPLNERTRVKVKFAGSIETSPELASRLNRQSIRHKINGGKRMSITADGWSNRGGTGERSCKCGTWKQHWINYANSTWPSTCSVQGCTNSASLGAHVINSSVSGEKIVPMCDSCNKLTGKFTLKGGVTLPSANTSETCD